MADVRAAPPVHAEYAPPPAPAPESCVTCGRPAGTPFCPHCGERRAADHPYTLRAVAAETWDLVTPADARALRSLWTLVRRPGALTVAYMEGVRRPYLPPAGVFLLVNGAYFVYTGVSGQHMFDTPLRTHLSQTVHSPVARRLVQRRLAARRQTLAEYAPRFDRVVATQAKTLIGVMVPGLALACAAVGVRRGRRALHHVAFGFHAMSAFLVSLMGTTFVVYLLARGALALGVRVPQPGDLGGAIVLTLPLFAWLVLALRRAYGDGAMAAVVKAAVLMVALVWVLFGYRAVLFFTAFLAT